MVVSIILVTEEKEEWFFNSWNFSTAHWGLRGRAWKEAYISQPMPEGVEISTNIKSLHVVLALTFCTWLFSSSWGIVTHYKHGGEWPM